ncbi:AraC family transcriptional regulator [Pseudomonas sp. AF32]|uniref:helix-turn-helix transcriptional regulator n=1 Tax=Pseudomonas sp. AF32 TaxID=554390 RepID=UPI001EEE232C|nr:AraC family transcriptional regulator [Pseudomonas sp. AF32]MCG6574543.1 AraC family transcriptional regulator [Pseudomonas sp. AF32]
MRPILTLRQYSQDLIVHSHDHAQLVFGLSGALDFEIEGCGSQVVRQSFVVVPAGAHHACDSPHGSRCLVMDVPGDDWIDQCLGEHADASRRLLGSGARLPLDAGQSQLVCWLASSRMDDPLIARQGAVLLLASLNGARPATTGGRRLPYAALDAHIDQYAAYPLQVADLAQVAGLSSARLHARFVAECGQTPMEYIRSRRLHKAVGLLRDTDLPIGEVAHRVGYSSQSAFAAAVLREFGVSPSKLRR